MGKKSFRIKPYAHERLKFVVTSNLNGRRQRKFFGTKREAETYVEIKEVELLNQGTEGTTFSTELRVLAQRSANILQPFGKTVLDAAEFYADYLRSMESSRTVSTVIDELITAREEDGLSVDYVSDLKIKFRGFSQKFGDRMIAGVTAKEVSDWVRSLKVGPVSKNTVRSRLATLFSFAKKAGYTKANPIADVERAKERETEVGILKIAEVSSLMGNAKVETLPFWAIGAFAGLRSAEIERLEWHDIDFEDGLIEVKASKAKLHPVDWSQCCRI